MSSVWKWPLEIGPTGVYAELDADAAAEQALRHLVLTEPGERLLAPDLGVPLRRLLYEPVRLVSEALVRVYIKIAVRRYLKDIQVVQVQVNRIEQESGTAGFSIRIVWRRARTQQLRQTAFSSLYEKTR
jgi:phage baseplate assembly protein W